MQNCLPLPVNPKHRHEEYENFHQFTLPLLNMQSIISYHLTSSDESTSDGSKKRELFQLWAPFRKLCTSHKQTPSNRSCKGLPTTCISSKKKIVTTLKGKPQVSCSLPVRKVRQNLYALDQKELPREMQILLQEVTHFFTHQVTLERQAKPLETLTYQKPRKDTVQREFFKRFYYCLY